MTKKEIKANLDKIAQFIGNIAIDEDGIDFIHDAIDELKIIHNDLVDFIGTGEDHI